MSSYEPDIFYDTGKLNLEQKKELLTFALSVCDKWHTDTLDCNISWARQRIEMSFGEIFKKLDDKCHFTFINRKGFKTEEGEPLDGEYVIEVGFCTLRGTPEYFLWIYCNENQLPNFVSKFNLSIRK